MDALQGKQADTDDWSFPATAYLSTMWPFVPQATLTRPTAEIGVE